MEPELIALACEVAAAAASARNLLARIPDGADRRRLLKECELLERAAKEVADPRSQLHKMPDSSFCETFEVFMQYQVQSAVLRGAAIRLASKRETSPAFFRRRMRTRS